MYCFDVLPKVFHHPQSLATSNLPCYSVNNRHRHKTRIFFFQTRTKNMQKKVISIHDRRTLRHTLFLVCVELPPTGAGAFVGYVAWFTELRAALVLFQSAQSLVCIVKTKWKACRTCKSKMMFMCEILPSPSHLSRRGLQ